MAELTNPMPKRSRTGKAPARPLEAPPAPPRYVGSVWRPNAPGFPDTPRIPARSATPKDQQQ